MKRILLTNMIAAGMAIFCLHVVAAPIDQRDQRGEQVMTILDQKEPAVTIYNNDLALVKDARRVNLEREYNKPAWRGASAQMRPETALLRNISHLTGLQEQNFNFDSGRNRGQTLRSPLKAAGRGGHNAGAQARR